MLRARVSSVLFAGAMLAGCATAPADLSPTNVAPYRQTIELEGHLSVNYQKDGRAESLSGKFSWQQTAARVDVSLASPLGQTIATVSVTPQSATLTQADHVPRVAADVNTLTAQVLGWSLPVADLRDWLQGYARNADGSRFVASRRNDSVNTPDGWRLRFVSWQDDKADVPVPKRIDAERSATLTTDELAIHIFVDAPD